MTSVVIITLYAAAMLFIFSYSLVQVHLVYKYVRSRSKAKKQKASEKVWDEFPLVTIQLPVYNEKYVVERLIESVSEFDYPKDRFEIQVLDDSTDESVEIIAKKVAEMKALGVDIKHVRRDNRHGFKAGALQDGLNTATGEFIAIFDADFLPPKNFLKKTLPHFIHDKIGVVQTRWGHINEKYSLLTRMQAFALDAHFSVEQRGRNAGGYFINFNGTGGVWRKDCIEDAGGWQSDTLTEDLDLSYRAQLNGWEFKFLENQISPAELPAAMEAIKSQQFRWTKGAAEVARKNLWKVLKAKLSFSTKLHAFFHLMNTAIFICVLLTAILSVPLLMIKVSGSPEVNAVFDYAHIFLISLLALVIFFWTSRTKEGVGVVKQTINFIFWFPMFLAVSMGFSLHNAIAVFEGYAGRKSPFIRTPKFNIKNMSDTWKDNTYTSGKITFQMIVEGLLMLYFMGGITYGIWSGDYAMLPFHVMLSIGYGVVFFYSMKHALVKV